MAPAQNAKKTAPKRSTPRAVPDVPEVDAPELGADEGDDAVFDPDEPGVDVAPNPHLARIIYVVVVGHLKNKLPQFRNMTIEGLPDLRTRDHIAAVMAKAKERFPDLGEITVVTWTPLDN